MEMVKADSAGTKGIATTLLLHTLSKHRTPVSLLNNSNNPDSISTIDNKFWYKESPRLSTICHFVKSRLFKL